MIIDEDDYLEHYGTPRHSGRYPWGSGGVTFQNNKDFLDHVKVLEKEGMSETEIAEGLGISTTRLRNRKSAAIAERRQADITQAQKLKDKGYSNVEIGKRMDKPESTIRSYLAPGAADKANVIEQTSKMLKEQVAEKKYLDVGSGVENHIGISATKLRAAVDAAVDDGYTLHSLTERQLGTGKDTRRKVLAGPDVTIGEVLKNKANIQQIMSFTDDGGRSYLGIHPPISISPSRVSVRYGHEGGAEMDGVIFTRPGVKDVSLEGSRYSQVRVKVGDDHYLKGMAIYKDGLPDGVDLVFNTNKDPTGNHLDAMKPIKDDPDNPFGSYLKRQIVEHDKDGKEVVTSAMNIVREEGDWTKWSKTISSQMLSKQSPRLAKNQLDMTYEERLSEYNSIAKLTNPTVKRLLLDKFGDSTDSAAVHLDAAGLKGQSWHVILPLDTIKPNEVYAPNFPDGQRVALIRFPHAGTFEIPDLTVNNKQREAKTVIGGAKDAVGIHHTVADRLSGADFDGDTVLVIPNDSGRVKISPALDDLKNFDPRRLYKEYPGMHVMTTRETGIEMGKISNLITDMTLRQASTADVARAVKHSMVVIDAEKHKLNYKQSAIDNNIPQLKERYQGGKNKGASTLISRATATDRVNQRKLRLASEGGPIDKATGKKVYVETGKTSFRTGQPLKEKVARLALTDDAHTLSSDTPMERVYAEHSNKLKALANQARKEASNTPRSKYSKSAKEAYSNEVKTLNASLDIAIRNRPLERHAQTLANGVMRAKLDAEPHMDDATKKKLESQALQEMRNRTGAQKSRIYISDEEWNAIQAGAISESKLTSILQYADLQRVKELATPRVSKVMTTSKARRAQDMLELGYTRAQVAQQLGVSLTTLSKSINELEGPES